MLGIKEEKFLLREAMFGIKEENFLFKEVTFCLFRTFVVKWRA
jgi:hypothetical protein